MPAGDSMPDTYIAIMLQSLKKKEQVLDEIIRLDDRQKDTLMDPECPFDVFDETVEAKSACIDQLAGVYSFFINFSNSSFRGNSHVFRYILRSDNSCVESACPDHRQIHN